MITIVLVTTYATFIVTMLIMSLCLHDDDDDEYSSYWQQVALILYVIPLIVSAIVFNVVMGLI